MKDEDVARLLAASKEYAKDKHGYVRDIWEQAYRDGRRQEYYHQEAQLAAKDAEIQRLKALCVKQFDDMMEDAKKQGVSQTIIDERRPQYIKENNLQQ